MFEWDPTKGRANAAKHGVGFEEAATVFADQAAMDGPDLKHSARGEERRLVVGKSIRGRTIVVAYTLRSGTDGQTIRIISARPASRKERRSYEEGTASD